MIHKLYYKPSINVDKSHKIEIMEGDIVKVDLKGDKLYKVVHLYDSDLRPLLFYRCGIRDLDTFMEGYDSIFGGNLIFVEREFYGKAGDTAGPARWKAAIWDPSDT